MDPSLWTDEFLDRMREHGDADADAAVESLYGGVLNSAETFRRVNTLVYQLTYEGELDVEALPAPVREYTERSALLPGWADTGLIERGQELFLANGFGASVLLMCASLPECYVMSKGVHVLGLTTYLERRPWMRILETSQLVREVMTPGQLVEGGAGVLAAQKVRLLHAAVRRLILSDVSSEAGVRPGPYAGAAWQDGWGHPICQEDMAYTLQTFAYVVLRGLDDLGVDLTADDREAYIHCWNVVGHILGIDRRLIPEPERDDVSTRWDLARALYERCRRRQEGQTEEGRALTQSLIALMEDVIADEVDRTRIIKHIGGRKLKYVPVFLMLHLLGRRTVDLLGVQVPQATRMERFALRIMLGTVKRGERVYQRRIVQSSFLHASVALHQMVTARVTQLPVDHKQVFLPEHIRRHAEQTGRRPFEIVADPPV